MGTIVIWRASYEKEVKVTREDKKDGTPGIRTIFEGIRSSEVFTIVFKKQDKAKTKKQFESEKEAQRMEAISMIDKAKRQKKSMATAYKEALEFVQSNPIKDYTEGEGIEGLQDSVRLKRWQIQVYGYGH